MRRFIICLLTALALSVSSAHAGPGASGHSHAPVTPITAEKALATASSAVAAIVQKGKLDGSWAKIEPTQAKMKKFKHGQEWVVTFTNPKVTDQEKKTLYVFLSADGQYLAANFSGN